MTSASLNGLSGSFFHSESFYLQFLANDPEIQELECQIDRYFWSISRANNALELKDLFLNFIQKNESCLSKRTPVEKANVIFDSYRKAYFLVLKTDRAFCQIVKKLGSGLEDIIQHIVFARIKTWHSIVPGKVLEEILSLSSYSLKLHAFPDSFSDISQSGIDISNFSTFHQENFCKFGCVKAPRLIK